MAWFYLPKVETMWDCFLCFLFLLLLQTVEFYLWLLVKREVAIPKAVDLLSGRVTCKKEKLAVRI